ncbi:hypothetical protein B5X24_HaOG205955 [Helicoverpa armigera]|uniref:Uncharacterized protein n=1 Tax=Helicoverpa armigera TaxID=29058 RepID=A0A2W1BSH5_HELAM|nr:hypothetical protein B5X24_HaOG205955 [Helicoverpa armigera]
MAGKRIARKALDLALGSLKKIKPAVKSLWGGTKEKIKETSAKPLVENQPVEKLEKTIDNAVTSLSERLKTERDKQLPEEYEYLKKELDDVKKRLGKRPPSAELDKNGENIPSAELSKTGKNIPSAQLDKTGKNIPSAQLDKTGKNKPSAQLDKTDKEG